ncbi:MAG: tetratricopeptide repeat protein [Bacteroidales bacterium]|nr:tetratricopeptide repeat protein [Bacteroidales bacterium]
MRKVFLIMGILLCSLTALAQTPLQKNVDGAILDAVKDFESGNRDSALKKLSAILEIIPDSDAAHYYFGAYSYSAGDIDAAEKHFMRAAELDSTNLWYQDALATLYTDTGRPGAAAEIYARLLEKSPSQYHNYFILTLLGDRAGTLGKLDEAMDWYEKALEMEPEYTPAKLGKAEIFRIRRDFPAYFGILRSVAADPMIAPEPKTQFFATTFSAYSQMLFPAFPADIRAIMDAMVEAHPDNDAVHTLNLEVLLALQDMEGVIRECEVIIGMDPADSAALLQCYSLMGDCHYSLGEHQKAFDSYEKALKVNPGYCPVLNNYAYYLSQQGKKLRKALKMSKYTIEQEPDNPTYLDTYGWLLHLLGRDKDAKPVFKHAMIYGGKDSAVVTAHYAEVLRKLGENDVADYYQRLSESK